MALTPGARLGPYEILALIGAGGMGEVYRAQDTRLDRTVAIKVLPAHLASDPELKRRFEREARAISSLSHPNICVLHDIGHQDGIDFLVMEHLEGETLAKCLERGALPLDQALAYAIQIADALEKAHRHGVVHRDLKPGNIILTKAGPKLVDFGLAKSKRDAVSAAEATASISGALTTEGSLLGTFQYMAPEQLEGKEADARSDIWAFGCVLYEMLAGRPAFSAASQASLIAAIMERDPAPLSTVHPAIPPLLDHIAAKALARNPDRRWQTARDLMDALRWVAESASPAPSAAAAPAPLARDARISLRERLFWPLAAVAAVALLAAFVLGLGHWRRLPADLPRVHFQISPPEGARAIGFPRVSPDGSRVAFAVTDSSGKSQIWVRPLNSLASQPIPATEGTFQAAIWSPDSSSVAFVGDGKLKKAALAGGPAQTLCHLSRADTRSFDADWSRQDLIIVAGAEGLYSVPGSGGALTALTKLDASRHEFEHTSPRFLPDGRRYLYSVIAATEEVNGIYLGSLDSGQRKRVLSAGAAEYALPGYLLFLRSGALLAQKVDPGNLETVGQPAIVSELAGSDLARPAFSVSQGGVLALSVGGGDDTQFVWYHRSGKPLGPVGPAGPYNHPALSPDGKRLALEASDPQTANLDIWLLELSRGVLSRLTFHPEPEHPPVWSPDGRWVAYESHREGIDIYRTQASGGGREELLLKWSVGLGLFVTDWSSDGKFIAYAGRDPKTKNDLWLFPLEGDRKPFPLLQTAFNETQARFAPRLRGVSRWIAYTSDESGRPEVYVTDFSDPPGKAAGKWQISSGGSSQPIWRHDGKELFYVAADNKLMAVEIRDTAPLEASAAKPLFELPPRRSSRGRFAPSYAVEPGAQRFLVSASVQRGTPSPITIVLNWTKALKR